MKTTERLARALEEVGAPSGMIEAAMNGRYDDYESNFPTPCIDLVNDCHKHGLESIATRAKNGEFDATKEESDAWWEREGRAICPPGMRSMFERKRS